MKIAIVGTTVALTEVEEMDVRKTIALVLKDYSKDDTVLSGCARGVDTMALDIARGLGMRVVEYKPNVQQWSGFKKRNLEIAETCDVLYCISVKVHKVRCYHHTNTQDHEKTAGCWTMNQAKRLRKTVRLIIV